MSEDIVYSQLFLKTAWWRVS